MDEDYPIRKYVDRARSLLNNGELQRARQSIQEGLVQRPQSTELMWKAAYLAWQMRDIDEARRQLDRLQALPERVHVSGIMRLRLSLMIAQENGEPLLAFVERYGQLFGDDPSICGELAFFTAMISPGKTEEAIERNRQAQDPMSLDRLIVLLCRAGDRDRLGDALAESRRPEHLQLRLYLALTGDARDEAVFLSGKLRHAAKSDEGVALLVAWADACFGEVKAAQVTLDRIGATKPQYIAIRKTIEAAIAARSG